MANARSIINQAARKIAVLGRGQTMPADEVNSALETLNGFLSTLSAETGTLYALTRESFPLNGAQSYSIGVGGDFNTSRPALIEAVYLRIGTVDYPLAQMGAEDYANIPMKGIAGIPDMFFYQNSSPLGRIFIYPTGSAGQELHIWSKKALTEFADLTTDYSLPEGVEEMLVYNLAIRLAPDYEKEPTPFVVNMARQTKLAVESFAMRNNYPTSGIDVADGPANQGNIFSGWLAR